MNEHDQIRERLALAVAGALPDQELQLLERHAASCPDCAARLQQYRAVAHAIRRLPTPQPAPAVVERARAAALREFAAAQERRSSYTMVVLLGLFAWALTLTGGFLVVLITGGVAAAGRLMTGHIPPILALYAALAWVAAGAAAVALGGRFHQNRRMHGPVSG